MHELLELARTQVPPFRAAARGADRDALAATLTELDTVLREHMADEERYVLPLVEEHLTVAEWAALGERGRAGIPKDRLLIQLGWMLDGTSAADRREFLSHLPLACARRLAADRQAEVREGEGRGLRPLSARAVTDGHSRLALVQRWHGLDAVPTGWGHCVVTIGVFDGVHRGHADIIGRAVAQARQRGVPSVLMTFVPHPSEVVRPGSHPPVLTTIVRRAELVEQLGVDVFLALPFTLEFSQLPPDEFVHRALVERLHASGVIVGENFRYGHKAAGDVAELQRLGARFGFTAEGVTLLRDGDTTLSATYVRSCVQAGDMTAATEALGRPHRVDGIVERGDQRGRELGFPTANLRTEQWTAVPADGVYAGRVGAPGRMGTNRPWPAARAWPRSRSAPTRPSRCASAGSRPSCSTSTATCTATRWASSSSTGCAAWSATTRSTRWSSRCTRTSPAPAQLVQP